MATPHVAAVAALVMSKCPADTPSQVLGRIRTGTTPVTGFRNRVVTDGVVGTSTVSSATAAFTAKDVGQTLSGTGIPAGATIQVVVDATTVVLSQAPPAALTGVTLTIGGTPPGMVNAANATAAC
jgi:subtilisin family serine protease